MVIKKLGWKLFDIKRGEQIIEFTPQKEGIIPWSCWMGMIPGVFVVEDDVSSASLDEVELPPASSCGSNGGCGCGG